jgi:tetratricopeptide (TPR) repeat protein
MLAGDFVAAEAELRRDYDTLDRLGERSFITTVAAYLAEALYRQGRYADADTFAAFSAKVAAADDLATQVMWREVRAKLLAREGRFDEAESLGREAVELSRRSDDPVGQANALMDLAEVVRTAGRDATDAATEALRLYEHKGNVVSAKLSQAFLARAANGVRARARKTDRVK